MPSPAQPGQKQALPHSCEQAISGVSRHVLGRADQIQTAGNRGGQTDGCGGGV